jgi:hypothetical protein
MSENKRKIGIGRLIPVHLREVWRHEALDFTAWLFNNLDILAAELGFSLNPEEREKKVGPFAADIVASNSEGHRVVIENQLEQTDHSHLGQLLTYIANLGDTKAAIWISPNPRYEHKRAVEWLDENVGDIAFYLVRVEAWKIGDSPPAPKFTIIAGPTDVSRAIGEKKKQESELQESRRNFWRGLIEKGQALEKGGAYSDLQPGYKSFLNFSAGIPQLLYSFDILWPKEQEVSLWMGGSDRTLELNKQIFGALHKHKTEIENLFGGKLKWKSLKHSCRIVKPMREDLSAPDSWHSAQNEMLEIMTRLRNALDPHLKKWKEKT